MTIDVAVCVIRRGGQVLIAQRKKDDHFGGFWEFPGGKREDDETLEECAVREALEEVGVQIQIESFLRTVKNPYPNKSIDLHFFLCTLKSGDPRALECDATQWVQISELPAYLFPPANRDVIEDLVKAHANGRH